VSDRWIRLATYPAGAVAGARKTRLLDWVGRFLPQAVAVFGEAPFKRYTIFQVSDSIVNGGGLEHQDSQLDEVPTGSLDAADPSLYSHELFHAWNVKRLRPADLVPYRYDDAQPSRWLWVSEGVTDYYAELVLARAGVITDSAFAAAMASDAAEVMSSPPIAAADASLQAWIAPTDGTGSIYYPKGAAIGFLLDILIRDASDGRHSLDDVMRDLYLSTYKQGRGFTADEWWRAVSRAANGKSFAEFARRYVDGREPLPFDSVLALAALATSRETVREPRMGLSTNTDTAGVRVAALVSGGAAAVSGMLAGDQLVSLGDVPITNNGSFDAFRARYAGTALATIPAVVRRQGREVTLTLPIRLVQREIFRIRPLAQPSARATSLYRALLAPRQPGA
jgi:predicted metalloprotease with PDZ domain